MFEWAVTDGELRVVTPDGRRLAAASDWVRRDGAPTRRRPALTLVGSATSLWLRPVPVTVTALDAADRNGDGSVLPEGETTLPAGRYRVRADGDAPASARFDGPATVRRDASGVTVDLAERAAVALDVRPDPAAPAERVTVPPTPAGLAAALTRAGETPLADGPARSRPDRRPHPPRFDFDADARLPSAGERAVELLAPPSFDALFSLAPLAYYLGARVRTDPDCGAPHLRTSTLDRALASPAEDAPALLERVFWLDCLVRDHAGEPPAETALLADLDLDAAACREAGTDARLARYLDAPFERVADRLPTWHLAAYVAPTVENAAALPFLLDRLALVYPPETDPLSGKELMERSLDEFYRGRIPSVDVVKPRLREAVLHGWLAPETPIDVFTCPPVACENRLPYRGRSGPTRVVVVLNDAAMAGEHDAVAAAYRERAAEAPVDVTVRRNLTTAALADVFAAGPDLVHYIGHCETGGLQCADGFLSTADLTENDAQTFFLNACGSYHEGVDLVRTGSAAGAVTYREVLDEQAATVGTTFARLLTHGFSFERAVQLSRRRVMMGKNYAVVGDGTHVLAQSATDVPVFARVTTRSDGRYRLVCEAAADRTTGGVFRPRVPGASRPHLCGVPAPFSVDRDDLVTFLSADTLPVVFDGSFYWSSELVSRL